MEILKKGGHLTDAVFFRWGLHRSLFLSDTCDHLGDGSSHNHILQKILSNDKLFSVT